MPLRTAIRMAFETDGLARVVGVVEMIIVFAIIGLIMGGMAIMARSLSDAL